MQRRLVLALLAAVAVLTLAVTIPLHLTGALAVPGEQQLLKGSVVMELTRPNGDVEVREFDNLIVDGGFDAIAAALGDSSIARPAAFNYIAVGTDGTAAASGNTALGSQLARKVATYAHTAGTKVWTLTVTFDAGEATGAVRESGVFNAAAAGAMLSRQTFEVVNKAATDTLVVTWTYTLSQG